MVIQGGTVVIPSEGGPIRKRSPELPKTSNI